MYFSCIGCSLGEGAGTSGSEKAPHYLKHSLNKDLFQWESIIESSGIAAADTELIAQVNQRYAEEAYKTAQKTPFFLAFGGDHSTAIGTWSGVAESYRDQGDVGLIWVDAHMDAHTPQTSPSGNIHGMPLAHLLGYGDPLLTHILSPMAKVRPENVILIGIRSYEPEERKLLEQLNVKICYIEEVHQKGFPQLLGEAINTLSERTIGYGISFDIDVIDPAFIQATGTPVPNGMDESEAIAAMKLLAQQPPIAFELVEYNPTMDHTGETFSFIQRLLSPLEEMSLDHLSRHKVAEKILSA